MGKLAQDFTFWLEQARPWMSCAAPLIALRVEQILGGLDPQTPSEGGLKKFSDLLEEARRHLQNPGLPIQVIDLEMGRISGALSQKETGSDSWTVSAWEGVVLPMGLIEIPEALRTRGYSSVAFQFFIPN